MTDNVVTKIKDALEGIIGDRKTVIKILSVVLILLIALVMRIHDQNKSDITIVTEAEEAAEEQDAAEDSAVQSQVLFVDIGGAVNKPGVYEVSKDTRLFEVIEMAGGLSEDADTDHVNRASFVEDGQKIIIPYKGEAGITSDMAQSGNTAYGSADGLININTASAEELQELPGIGEVMAERIIEYRSSNTFKIKEDIMSVDGIGSRTYEKIKDRITV